MKTNGTYKCPIDIQINITELQNKFYEILEQTLADLTLDYLNDNTDGTDTKSAEFDGEDTINIKQTIEGSYTETYFAATLETPPEDDIDFEPEDFSCKELNDYINTNLSNALLNNLKELSNIEKPIIVNDIEPDFDNAELSPNEPDWDSMPGGYDDI